jgi:hypothetical protein
MNIGCTKPIGMSSKLCVLVLGFIATPVLSIWWTSNTQINTDTNLRVPQWYDFYKRRKKSQLILSNTA